MLFGNRRRPTRDEVITAYRLLLGRDPEDESAIEGHRRNPSLLDLVKGIAGSPEFSERMKSSPFRHYNASFDAPGTIRKHENPERRPIEGHVVDFLGVAMNTRFVPAIRHLAGTVESAPIPANWHADVAEWAAALRAVDLARITFVMIELGCGWGCWMNITATAAKRRGLAVHAIGVEGDRGHLEFAREACRTNGLLPSEHTLHAGIAAARPGVALFPRQDRPGEDWGCEPVFDASPEDVAKGLASGRFDEVATVPLSDVIGSRERIDLLHVDIQGGEAALIHDCRALLSERVAYAVLGTHSRPIEGRLFDDLLAAGWVLEIERPAILALGETGPRTTVDGVQGWRNPRLAPHPQGSG